ncbi:MAG: sulfur carrier protein [Chlamydiales bacterium]|jgi:sulfur carrier protein
MNIKYNGEESIINGEPTLLELLKERQIDSETRGIAVAMNDSVLPRSFWEECYLSDGDRVEVIHAVQGG